MYVQTFQILYVFIHQIYIFYHQIVLDNMDVCLYLAERHKYIIQHTTKYRNIFLESISNCNVFHFESKVKHNTRRNKESV